MKYLGMLQKDLDVPTRAQIKANTRGIYIDACDQSYFYSHSRVRSVELEGETTRLYLDNATVSIEDPLAFPKFNKFQNSAYRSFRKNIRMGVFIVGISLISLIYIVVVGIPNSANTLAFYAPATLKDQIGNKVLNNILLQHPQCDSKYGSLALSSIVDELKKYNPDIGDVDVRVVHNQNEFNAIATMGGRVLIYDGLLRFVQSQSEFIAILAHEIGHTMRSHPSEQLIREIGIFAVFNLLMRNEGSIFHKVINLKNSQQDELEADLLAIEILKNANISTKGFEQFFLKVIMLQEGQELTQTVSSHPPNYDRLGVLLQSTKGYEGRFRLLSDDDWQALKDICHEKRMLAKPNVKSDFNL